MVHYVAKLAERTLDFQSAEHYQGPRSGVAGWAKAPPIIFVQYICLH